MMFLVITSDVGSDSCIVSMSRTPLLNVMNLGSAEGTDSARIPPMYFATSVLDFAGRLLKCLRQRLSIISVALTYSPL